MGKRLLLWLISLAIFCDVVKAQNEYGQSELDQVIDKINAEFRKAGIKEGNVQHDGKGKIRLTGTFYTYDEFLLAHMIAQLMAGDKFNPIYDNVEAIIKATTAELCFPYAVAGKTCPYGRFSIDMPAKVKTLKTNKKMKYALVIGVSKFANKIPGVPGADNDAKAFAEYLQSKGYQVKLLVDEQATQQNVKKAIEEILGNIKDGDEFVFFAASHGGPVDYNGETAVVLYDSAVIPGRECQVKPSSDSKSTTIDAALKMCALVKNGLSIKEHIINPFASKKVNIAVFIDACYSGDALKPYIGVEDGRVISLLPEYKERIRYMPNLAVFVAAADGNNRSWGGTLSGTFKERLLSFTKGSPRFLGSGGAKADKELAHGVFTAFFLNALPMAGDSAKRAYELAKGPTNEVSREMCTKAEGGRSIALESSTPKCPPQGQNPVFLSVNKEDYLFMGR